jgi:disulfide bond formation protein DsbB
MIQKNISKPQALAEAGSLRAGYKASARGLPLIGFAIAGASATLLLAAHIMEWLKLAPCELCLRQREAYWIAIPLALGAAVIPALRASLPKWLVPALLAAAGFALIYGAARAAEHYGVVAHWWISACTSPKHLSMDDVLAGRTGAPLVPCDQAPKFLGVPLPAYNFVAASALAAIALGACAKSLFMGTKA